MRVVALWVVLAISAGVFVAMLLALRNYRARNAVLIPPKAVAEYGWAIVPWLIVALGAAPAVHHIFAAR